MNGTIAKLYNVLVIGGTLATAACDRPAQRPPTTPSPDAQAASAPTPATPAPAVAPATAPAPAHPNPVTPAPAAGGVRGWFGG